MPHDIIDNRREKLVDHINALLPQSERARFASARSMPRNESATAAFARKT